MGGDETEIRAVEVVDLAAVREAKKDKEDKMASKPVDVADTEVELERLMKECGIETEQKLDGIAYALFIWAARKIKDGRTIGSADENDQFFGLTMPWMESLKKQNKK